MTSIMIIYCDYVLVKDPITNPEDHPKTTVREDNCYFELSGCEGGAKYYVQLGRESESGGSCDSCAKKLRNEHGAFQSQTRIKGR